MISEVKIGSTIHEVDNPKLIAALSKCKTEKAAEAAIQRTLKTRREKVNDMDTNSGRNTGHIMHNNGSSADKNPGSAADSSN